VRHVIALALLGVTAFAQPVTYQLDPADSAVNFTLGDVLHTVHGSFKVRSGAIQFDPSTGKAGGEIVVNADSGESGSGARDSRMKKNILETQKYPDIVFHPDRVDGPVAPQGRSQIKVHGMFRIHGADHEVTLPGDVDIAADRMTATLHFQVPYVEWGMKNPSTLFLRVEDKVAIDIRAVGRPQSR
jgi:polyisoprenoid-binding protein YceI